MNPKTYYAHPIGFVERGSFSNKFSVNFEAVPQEAVEMFVTGVLPDQMSGEGKEFIAGSRFFEETWNCFNEYGPESEEFAERIPMYLSEVPDVQIMLLFEDPCRAYQIWEEQNDWWEIQIYYDSSDPDDDVTAFSSEMPEDDMDMELHVERYGILPGEVNEILYDLYAEDGERLEKTGNAVKQEPEPVSFGAITPATVFSKVQVLYVGAGLSCRLVDQAGHVVGYFDMGQELPLSAAILNRFPTAAVLHQTKQISINVMTQDAAAGTALTVILSHWHYDHVRVLGMLARDYLQNGNYAAFWTNLTLICPAMVRLRGWSVTDYTSICAVMNRINPNGMHFVQHAPVFQTQMIQLGNNITLYKGDAGGAGAVLHHPHNHGLAAAIRLGGMGGNVAFLPGDCSYDTLNGLTGVLDRGGIGYEYLVATHHGGTYTHNLRSNPAVIPVPDGQVNSNLIYSANGVAYGHPDFAVMTEYANQNWNHYKSLNQFCQTGQYYAFELL